MNKPPGAYGAIVVDITKEHKGCAGLLVSHPMLGLGRCTKFDDETKTATIHFLQYYPGLVMVSTDPSLLHWHTGEENSQLFKVIGDKLMEMLPEFFSPENAYNSIVDEEANNA